MTYFDATHATEHQNTTRGAPNWRGRIAALRTTSSEMIIGRRDFALTIVRARRVIDAIPAGPAPNAAFKLAKLVDRVITVEKAALARVDQRSPCGLRW